MKKTYSLSLALPIALVLAACGGSKQPETDTLNEVIAEKVGLQCLPYKDSINSQGWGLMGLDGLPVLEGRFTSKPSNAVNGIFTLRNADGYYEYFTAEAQPRKIGGEYREAGLFYEDVAPCIEKDKHYIQFIRKDGQTAFRLDSINGHKVEWVGRFSEGLAPVKAGNLIGYINTEGKMVVAPRFIEAEAFSNGLAQVVEATQQNAAAYHSKATYRINFIDSSGKTLKLSFLSSDSIGRQFNEGVLWHVYRENDTTTVCEFLDREGRVIIPSKKPFQRLADMSGTHFAFYDGRAWGIADNQNSIILMPIYDSVLFIGPKSVCVAKYGLYKIKNYAGEQLSKSYDEMVYLKDGSHFIARKEDLCYILNEKGEVQGSPRHTIDFNDASERIYAR